MAARAFQGRVSSLRWAAGGVMLMGGMNVMSFYGKRSAVKCEADTNARTADTDARLQEYVPVMAREHYRERGSFHFLHHTLNGEEVRAPPDCASRPGHSACDVPSASGEQLSRPRSGPASMAGVAGSVVWAESVEVRIEVPP